MSLENLFGQLADAASVTNELKGHLGRSYGTQLGVLAAEEDRLDPLGLGRIRVLLPSKGGKTKTDWLFRAEPMPGLHLPVPQVGDTVMVGYLDGDPHRGVYYGVAQNKVNPAWEVLDGLKLQIGLVELTIYPDGRLDLKGLTVATIQGSAQLNMTFPQINLMGANINLAATTAIGFAAPAITFTGDQGSSAELSFDASRVTFDSPTVAFEGTSSMYVGTSGKQVATVDAIDSDGDTLITKGW